MVHKNVHPLPLAASEGPLFTNTLRNADSFITKQLLDKLVDFSAADHKDIFKPLDAFVGMNLKNRKLYGKHAQLLKGLAGTILKKSILTDPMPEDDKPAQAFFNYLEKCPLLENLHGNYITALRNYYLNCLLKNSPGTKQSLCLVLAAVNMGADDWLTANINKIGIKENTITFQNEVPHAFAFCGKETKLRTPMLEKHRPGSLDRIFNLLKHTPGVKFIETRQIREI